MDIFFCDSCGTRVSDADLRRGYGLRKYDVVICGSCIDEGLGSDLLEEAAKREAIEQPSLSLSTVGTRTVQRPAVTMAPTDDLHDSGPPTATDDLFEHVDGGDLTPIGQPMVLATEADDEPRPDDTSENLAVVASGFGALNPVMLGDIPEAAAEEETWDPDESDAKESVAESSEPIADASPTHADDEDNLTRAETEPAEQFRSASDESGPLQEVEAKVEAQAEAEVDAEVEAEALSAADESSMANPFEPAPAPAPATSGSEPIAAAEASADSAESNAEEDDLREAYAQLEANASSSISEEDETVSSPVNVVDDPGPETAGELPAPDLPVPAEAALTPAKGNSLLDSAASSDEAAQDSATQSPARPEFAWDKQRGVETLEIQYNEGGDEPLSGSKDEAEADPQEKTGVKSMSRGRGRSGSGRRSEERGGGGSRRGRSAGGNSGSRGGSSRGGASASRGGGRGGNGGGGGNRGGSSRRETAMDGRSSSRSARGGGGRKNNNNTVMIISAVSLLLIILIGAGVAMSNRGGPAQQQKEAPGAISNPALESRVRNAHKAAGDALRDGSVSAAQSAMSTIRSVQSEYNSFVDSKGGPMDKRVQEWSRRIRYSQMQANIRTLNDQIAAGGR